MNRRHLVLLVLIVSTAFTFAFTSAAAAELPTNDVPFDLEVGVGLAYIAPLQVFNIYWDDHWNDSGTNIGFSTSTIDAATRALTDSNYFDKLSQYGVPDITFGGSAFASSFLCTGQPGDTTSSVLVFLFTICEASTGLTGVPPAIGLPLPLPLVPNPTGHTIYNIILPRNTTIDDFGSKSCAAYGAYHFQVPSAFGFPIYFAVIPSKCATSPATLMKSISHEDIEAATDPLPLFHWIDGSTVTPGLIGGFASIPGLLKAGEASDLCSFANNATSSPFANVPVTFGGVAMNVASYWSNFDNACVVGPSRVVSATFETSGLPPAGAILTIGEATQDVTPGHVVTMNLLEGTTFSFGDVSDSAGSRFRAAGAGCTGAVTFPAGNTTADAAETVTCSYTHEVLLTVDTSPPAAATGNTSLTASGWVPTGTPVSLTADADVPAGAGSRYDFVHWESGGLTLPATPVSVLSPLTVTAVYRLQRLVTFDETGIPPATTWHVTVGGVPHTGPVSLWADDGSTQAFTYEPLVADASVSTTHYALTGTSTPSPLAVSTATTVIGSYSADATPPVITVADINAEATGPSGAVATFTPSANDPDDTPGPVTCSPASGSGFPLGSTLVTCHSTDTHSNTGSATFHVIVNDTTPPVIAGVPANITKEATGPAGAPVTYASPTATDLVDGSVPVACVQASGSTFPLGDTTVNCTASDLSGNSASASFKVTVKDSTPPLITVPANKVVNATTPGGAVVGFTATASDLVDITDPVTCAPASGSTFPIGHTTVTCNAVDHAGNHAITKSFDVYVKGAAAQLTDLLTAVTGVGPSTSLADKVRLIQGYVAANNKAAACTGLDDFINEVRSQSGKKLTAAQAASFTAQANNIKATLAC